MGTKRTSLLSVPSFAASMTRSFSGRSVKRSCQHTNGKCKFGNRECHMS